MHLPGLFAVTDPVALLELGKQKYRQEIKAR
jgi:hypothetical protein